jgi:putative phage-type endonuclease
MEEYVQENLDHIHKESFTQEMVEQVLEMLTIQFDCNYETSEMHNALKVAHSICLGRTTLFCPVQENIHEKLEQLQQKQPDQRSEQWYTIRHSLLTASSIYKVFGSDAKRNELICNKCGPVVVHASTHTEGPMHWGVKYEPVSVAYYCHVNQTKIQEYGCIVHPSYPFIGASPDGINVLETSPCYGRMLEIKNPYSREITGNPKEEYWIQCQVQMEVCDLDACDFLETSFKEYATIEDFNADGTFQLTSHGKYKGIILHFEINGEFHYEYAPFQCSQEEYNIWEENAMIQYPHYIKTIYWKLEDEHCTIIPRHKKWFQWALPSIIKFNSIIQEEKKSNVWENRLPKKKCRISL